MPAPSARSKNLDQLYVSKAEVKRVRNLARAIKSAIAEAEEKFDSELEYNFPGTSKESFYFWKRLKQTARRAKLTPLQYARKLIK